MHSLHTVYLVILASLPLIHGLCNNQFTCSNSGDCKSLSWICDNDNDCGDNSDERYCTQLTRSCESQEFQCDIQSNGRHRCLPDYMRCDGRIQCEDKLDESACGGVIRTTTTSSLPSCSSAQFLCVNRGVCINKSWVCDGDDDCRDLSDEQNCTTTTTTPTCRSDQFLCVNNGRCISKSWVCDGDNDCSDSSDEQNCAASSTCRYEEFGCDNGNCVPQRYQCDDDNDCGDGSDERDCGGSQYNLACAFKLEFQCDNGLCIRDSYECDGTDDCSDGSDERNCGLSTGGIIGIVVAVLAFLSCCCSCICYKSRKSSANNTPAATTATSVTYSADRPYPVQSTPGIAQSPSPYTNVTQWTSPTAPPPPATSDLSQAPPAYDLAVADPSILLEETVLGGLITTPAAFFTKREARRFNYRVVGQMRFCSLLTSLVLLTPWSLCRGTCVDQFTCYTWGNCISLDLICDNGKDCADGSDEWYCDVQIMSLSDWCNQFKCDVSHQLGWATYHRCIGLGLKCDGRIHCRDKSDEQDCPPVTTPRSSCPSSEFLCVNKGRCIRNTLVCDGLNDCDDWSDERGCTTTPSTTTRRPCHTSQFSCDYGDCLPAYKKCNNVIDCQDRSDELDCAQSTNNRYISTGETLGITFGIIAFLVLSGVAIFLCYKKGCFSRNTQSTLPPPVGFSAGSTDQSSSVEYSSHTERSTATAPPLEMTLDVSADPPAYAEAVADSMGPNSCRREEQETHLLPTYEQYVSGSLAAPNQTT